MEIPDPKYLKTADGVYIAYQVIGNGPIDIAWQFADFGNIDTEWDGAFGNAWYGGLASFSRLILHDRRATGLSSRNVAAPNLETRTADLRAVLDAAGSDHAVLGGWLEGLSPGVLLAATDPSRVQALVWWNPSPRTIWAPDYPWGWGPDVVTGELRALEDWGTYEYGKAWAEQITSQTGVQPPEDEVRFMAKSSRNTCTPDVALELTKIWWETDIRGVLPSVQVPALLITDGGGYTEGLAEYIASLMPRAEVKRIVGEWQGGKEGSERLVRPRLEAIQKFVGIELEPPGIDSILAAVLFTDIVASTAKQAALGDREWKNLVERHHAIIRGGIERWHGEEVDTAGDGFYATFDGPARGVRCALELRDRVRELGLEIRSGVHVGECTLIDGKVGGLPVTIGARIAARADASEVLVSQTVKDLVAGSGLTFEDAGEHDLKGVPDRWHLYRVVGERA